MRAFAEIELGHDHYDSWRDAEPCLTQPGTAFERIFKIPIWRYYAEHSEREALFGEAMTNLTAIANAGVLGSYQFATFSNVSRCRRWARVVPSRHPRLQPDSAGHPIRPSFGHRKR